MKIKSKKIGLKIIIGLLVFSLLGGFSLIGGIPLANADTDTDLGNEIQGKEAELAELEKKIKTYEHLIEVKQNQQATLSGQIDIMDTQVKKLEEEIHQTAQEMTLVELEIKQLELKIQEKDIDIKYKKKILSELIRMISHENKNGTLGALLKYENLGDYFTEMERLNEINQKTKNVLDEINQAKDELTAKKGERQDKFDKMEQLKKSNERNKYYLESEQKSKEELLAVTEGEEEKYQEMLSKFEAQKESLLGDMDQLSSENSGEIAQVKSKLKKPKTGLASTSWYFAQTDSRWGSDNIGNSRTKMANYGCAVTCVAMVLRYHGIKMDPGMLARQPIFYSDLIVWPSQWQSVTRVSSNAHGNISWDTIDKELKKGNPVIVFIRANGKGAGHYVVVHHKTKDDDYVVHDPYWGSNIYLDSSRALISSLYGTSTSIDQMIIYHGDGSGSTCEDKEECCEDSGGKWSKSKKKCSCPDGYEEEDDVCVEE